MASTTRITTGLVRLSYVHAFEPHGFEGQEPKYSVMALLPKTDTATLDKLREAEKAALAAGAAKFNGKVPAKPASIIKDGDDPDVVDDYPEREGHWYFTVRSADKPGVVDKDLNDILDKSELYSGCWARLNIAAFAYNVSGNKGVSFGLSHIQKIRDDEPLGGVAPSAQSVFSVYDED